VQEWREAQKRLMDQGSEHQSTNHDYVDDGVRLLELAKKAYFLFKKQNPNEKRRLLDFVCSNSTWKHGTLTGNSANPLIFWPLRIPSGKTKRPPEVIPATFVQSGSAGRSK